MTDINEKPGPDNQVVPAGYGIKAAARLSTFMIAFVTTVVAIFT